jgi:thioredoxin 1
MSQPYDTAQPERSAIDVLPGVTALDFGTNWCGYCRAAEPVIEGALAGLAGVRHLKVEDGPGRPLGRSFRVKLWPTVVVLKDGQEVADVLAKAGAA